MLSLYTNLFKGHFGTYNTCLLCDYITNYDNIIVNIPTSETPFTKMADNINVSK